MLGLSACVVHSMFQQIMKPISLKECTDKKYGLFQFNLELLSPVLSGTNTPGARFGTTITNLRDINNDYFHGQPTMYTGWKLHPVVYGVSPILDFLKESSPIFPWEIHPSRFGTKKYTKRNEKKRMNTEFLQYHNFQPTRRNFFSSTLTPVSYVPCAPILRG